MTQDDVQSDDHPQLDPLEAIEMAAQSRAAELTLHERVPPEVARLASLESLVVVSQGPISLPAEIAELPRLVSLDVGDAQLATDAWRVIGKLRGLRDLDVSFQAIDGWDWLDGLTGLRSLELLDCGIGDLPEEILRLRALRYLGLGGNNLESLPTELASLPDLRHLWLWGNNLTKVPDFIAAMAQLTRLRLDQNHISELPDWMNELSELEVLVLSDNTLERCPADLSGMAGLRTLRLERCELEAVPAGIRTLRTLESLDLSYNFLTEIPDWIGEIQSLEELAWAGNGTVELPRSIGTLRRLREFDLAENGLSDVAILGDLPELVILDLSENPLARLPASVGAFPKLKFIDIEGSERRLGLAPEIAESGDAEMILRYMRGLLHSERRPLNEAKLILVGQGGVGKTSLANMLLDRPFAADEAKTPGIDIRSWLLSVDNAPIRLNVWDFGGQEIMHATHQFFMTKRSVYLLVADARSSGEQNRLEYWLKLIQSFALDSPVIIVGNKCDQHQLDVDQRGLSSKYPNIRRFVETSCSEQVGFGDLRDAIRHEVSLLPHLHDELEASWFQVKDEIEKLDGDYIPYARYQELCVEHGLTEEASQATLVGFLHDLGVVINFRDDPRLEDTNILNPDWVTAGVYGILNSNLLFQNRGILDRDDLAQILDPGRFPASKHMFIVDMMRHFELCFDFDGYPDRRFLVPDLLPREEPFTGEWNEALAVEYHYDVLPGSVISRFIVRMHRHISQQTYWRNGVVVAREGARALVRGDTADGRLEIRVVGPLANRRDLLSVIRSELEVIHASIPGLSPQEHVRLPDFPNIVVPYEYLRDLERMGETSFVPVGLTQRVDVQPLLDGVQARSERRAQIDNRELRSRAGIERSVGELAEGTATAQGRGAVGQSSSSPWRSGGFYLVVFVACVAGSVGLAVLVAWYIAVAAMAFALAALVVIGALQLRQDGRLGDRSFVDVVTAALRSTSSPSRSEEAEES